MARLYGKPKKRFPWLLLILFVAIVYAFWILPIQLGTRQVQVEFVPAGAKR
ncbi:MAG: hypothetical protein H7Y17_08350 [Chlorobia bacterium]|nr:hypothetical protein [Fimbriimonadaceae bacterium]